LIENSGGIGGARKGILETRLAEGVYDKFSVKKNAFGKKKQPRGRKDVRRRNSGGGKKKRRLEPKNELKEGREGHGNIRHSRSAELGNDYLRENSRKNSAFAGAEFSVADVEMRVLEEEPKSDMKKRQTNRTREGSGFLGG